MKGNAFACDCVNILYYKCNKKFFNRGGSYIDPTQRLKNKKATINLENSGTKAFNMQ